MLFFTKTELNSFERGDPYLGWLFRYVAIIQAKGMIELRELETVQQQQNLNSVYALDEKGNGGANHKYEVRWGSRSDVYTGGQIIQFQHGPRNEEGSTNGVLGCDLLEMVRDTIADFQKGDYPSEENEKVLYHVERALYHMNKRVENRIKRNVLGTNQK